MRALEDDGPRRHAIYDADYELDGGTFAVMCGVDSFFIEVDAKDLRGSPFAEEYRRLVVKSDLKGEGDWSAYEELCTLLTQPCFALFDELAPEPRRGQVFTLHDLHYRTTHRLKVTVADQKLVANRMDGQPRAACLEPLIEPIHPWEFPDLPRVKATAVTIPENHKFALCDIFKVLGLFAFTEDGTKHSWSNAEVEIDRWMLDKYNRMAQANLRHLRIPRINGIVVSDDGWLTMGVLSEWIEGELTLQDEKARESKHLHARWKRQIKNIVKELHDHGIIMGFLCPGDILIDEHMNVWMRRLGTGSCEPYLPGRLVDTVEGDMYWMDKIFRCLEGEEDWQEGYLVIDCGENPLRSDPRCRELRCPHHPKEFKEKQEFVSML